MATTTWTHGGTPTTGGIAAFSGAAGTSAADYTTAMATWIATTNENGTLGGIVQTTAGSCNLAMFAQVQDNGSIAHANAFNSMRLQFDYVIVNGPMGGGVAQSDVATNGDPTGIHLGPGTSSGHYDFTANVGNPGLGGIATMGDFFTRYAIGSAIDAIGLIESVSYTGVFSAHARNLTISNFSITAAYALSASVTSVLPNNGTILGGTNVTITGSGFTAATGVTFGGTAATAVVIVNDTTITATTAAHASGRVDVVVASVATGTQLYTYVVPGITLPPIPYRAPVNQRG